MDAPVLTWWQSPGTVIMRWDGDAPTDSMFCGYRRVGDVLSATKADYRYHGLKRGQ